MKKYLILGAAFFMTGCATAKKDQIAALQFVNDKIEQSRTADCDTIHAYLNTVQAAVQDALAKLEK